MATKVRKVSKAIGIVLALGLAVLLLYPSQSGLGGPEAARISRLVGGLRPGDSIGGWRVEKLLVHPDKIALVEVGKGGVFFSVGIRAKGKGPSAPASTENYDITFGFVRGLDGGQLDSMTTPVVEEITTRVRANEKNVSITDLL